MRADRLLSTLLLLQTHERLTAADLAGRLEVSRRTVLRDMDALSAAGVPVYAQRGGGGGWSLLDAYRTDLTGLTEVEAQALVAAAPPPVLHDVGLGRAAEAALLKLLAALPARHHAGAAHARQRLYIDGAGWGQGAGAPPCLHVLQEAVWRDRKVRISYELSDDLYDPRPPDIVERLLDPLGLVAKGRSWYLVAAINGDAGDGARDSGDGRDGDGGNDRDVRGGVRAYRVSRIRAASIVEQPCARPPGFDLAEYWQHAAATFKANVPRYDVTVRASPAALPLVHKTHPYRWANTHEPTARAAEEGAGEDQRADGAAWTAVSLRFEVEEEAIPYILRFGGDLEVVSPARLRRKVAALAAAAAARYTSP
jgi:predicted DNA-binding transcriptional regulator YafY